MDAELGRALPLLVTGAKAAMLSREYRRFITAVEIYLAKKFGEPNKHKELRAYIGRGLGP